MLQQSELTLFKCSGSKYSQDTTVDAPLATHDAFQGAFIASVFPFVHEAIKLVCWYFTP
jgi:hypothetical protein